MAGTTHPIQLLIVDDDEDIRQDLARLFRKHGHEVTAAASGEDALSKAAHSRFDVALLDLHLPGISGIDVLIKLKEQQPELEALMLTAHISIETAVEAMRKGAYDYLTKPFRVADLEVHVQKAFEKVQLERREQQWLQQLSYESPRYRLVGSSPARRRGKPLAFYDYYIVSALAWFFIQAVYETVYFVATLSVAGREELTGTSSPRPTNRIAR